MRKHAESGFITSQFDLNNGLSPGENSLEMRERTGIRDHVVAESPKTDPDPISRECFKIISEHIYLIAQFSLIVLISDKRTNVCCILNSESDLEIRGSRLKYNSHSNRERGDGIV